jgi:allantoinase
MTAEADIEGRQRLWPGNKKIALAVGVTIHNNDSSERLRSDYGGRSGVWRVLHILDSVSLGATFSVSPQDASDFPEALRQIFQSGHDIAARDLNARKAEEDPLDGVKRVLDMLEKETGRRPEGWCSDQNSTQLNDALMREGILWRNDQYGVDLPFKQRTEHGSLAHVPWPDRRSPSVASLNSSGYFDALVEAADYLIRHEPMSLLSMTIDCDTDGYPHFAAKLQQCLKYILSAENVWVAQHHELVRWMFAQKSGQILNADRLYGNKLR